MPQVSGFGVAAALLSPLIMTVGFFIWDGSWKGSAFGLNVFKGTMATCIFMLTILVLQFLGGGVGFARLFAASAESINFLLLSSLLGIVVGDSIWLQALKVIGARRVIIIDSFKPGLGALLGTLLLGESCGFEVLFGLTLTTAGVLMVCLEEKPEDGKDESDILPVFTALYGYVLAFLNVAFDAYGAVLTKQYGTEEAFDTFEVNFVRFGSASLCLLLIGGAANLHDKLVVHGDSQMETTGGGFIELKTIDSDLEGGVELDGEVDLKGTGEDDEGEEGDVDLTTGGDGPPSSKWFEVPTASEMGPKDWALVAFGVLFVTYISNSLSNFALLEIDVSVCLTLTSIGPIFSLPVGYALKKDPITLRAVVGSVLSVVGIVVLVQ